MQINRSVWPEMTRLCAIGELKTAKKVYFSASASFFWLGSICSLILFFCSPWVFELWTVGKVLIDIQLFGLLLFAAMVNGFWYSALTILTANDSHRKVALFYMLITTLSLLLAYYLGTYYSSLGVAIAILSTEMLMLVVVLKFSLLQVNASITQLIEAITKLPLQLLQIITKRARHG